MNNFQMSVVDSCHFEDFSMDSLGHRVHSSFFSHWKNYFFHCFSMYSCLNAIALFFLNFTVCFHLEMAQLGNYSSGTAETPETDESVSVSIFLDEI